MTRWRVIPSAADIVVREKDYTAQFECHNVDSGGVVKIELTQNIGEPVSDLIGALRAMAQTLLRAASGSDEPAIRGEDRLN